MYTSGTTGKPKGCQHRTGGYLAYAAGTSKYYQDIHPEDVYWCMADIGWITGHSYIVYGPLALGATSVLYEGVPQFPDAARPWRIAERLDVNIFHTSPTAIRMLRKAGGDEPKKYNYHFKHMTTVGEPIEPEVWRWYYETVGKGEAVIVDTWWQTETGGFLCSTKPALDPMKPGSAGPAVLGIYPVIWDENGEEIKPGTGKAGNICIRNPWPGIMQTIWGSSDRFVNQYYKKYCKNPKSKDWRDWPYDAADGAVLPADGYYRILGRVDDVINVAGHRLGTKEVESACLSIPEIAEAAVVPVVDEIKGRVPEVYISLKPGVPSNKAIQDKVISTIETMIGKIARPKRVHIVPDMPKTRSWQKLCAACSQPFPITWIPATSPHWPTPTSSPKFANWFRGGTQGRCKKGPKTSSSSEKKSSRAPNTLKRAGLSPPASKIPKPTNAIKETQLPALPRREFLKAAAKTAAAASLLASSAFDLHANPLGLPIGCQTWPVRESIAKDLPGTIKGLAAAGFQTIELCSPVGYEDSGFGGLAKYKGSELKKMLKDWGVTCISSHFGMEELRKDQAGRIAWAQDLGLKQMLVASLDGPEKPDDGRREARGR